MRHVTNPLGSHSQDHQHMADDADDASVTENERNSSETFAVL